MDAIETAQYLIRDLNSSSTKDVNVIDVDNLNIVDVKGANNVSIALNNIDKEYATACSKTKYAVTSFIQNLKEYGDYVTSNINIARAKVEELVKMHTANKKQWDVLNMEPYVLF